MVPRYRRFHALALYGSTLSIRFHDIDGSTILLSTVPRSLYGSTISTVPRYRRFHALALYGSTLSIRFHDYRTTPIYSLPMRGILCVNRLVRASRAKTKLPRLHIQFHQHRVLIVPQTVERGLILVLSWVLLTRIDICFRVVLTRIDIHAHVGAHTARERSLMTRTRDNDIDGSTLLLSTVPHSLRFHALYTVPRYRRFHALALYGSTLSIRFHDIDGSTLLLSTVPRSLYGSTILTVPRSCSLRFHALYTVPRSCSLRFHDIDGAMVPRSCSLRFHALYTVPRSCSLRFHDIDSSSPL
eukprot:scaffold11502_cov185-Amphora_coffeaeformis.AAC.1